MNYNIKRDYYNDPAISQSMIKVFLKNKEEYYHRYILNNSKNEDTAAMGFGRYYHTLILEPDKIEERYITSDFRLPEGNMGKFIECLADMPYIFDTPMRFQEVDVEVPEGVESPGRKAYRESGFKISYSAVINKFFDTKNQDYYNYLITSAGREVIGRDDEKKAEYMYMKLMAKAPYLTPHSDENNDFYKVFRELDIFFTIDNTECKTKLDYVSIDLINRIVTIEDIKTTSAGNIGEFIESIKKYGYDIQKAFYIKAMKVWLDLNYPNLEFNIRLNFLPQKTSWPYQVLGKIIIKEEDVKIAENSFMKAIEDIKMCTMFNNWEEDFKEIEVSLYE